MGMEWFLLLLSLTVANCGFTHVKVSENESFDVPDLEVICGSLGSIANVSEKCVEQLGVVCENLTLLLTILDASSKFPYTGLMFVSKFDYGNFDQCLTVDHHYEGGRILGKHCTVGLVIPDPSDDMTDPSTYFRLSMCRPDACYASDYTAMVRGLVGSGFPELFQDFMCQTKESNRSFTAGDIITLCIFGIVIALMTVSTIYDVYIYQNQKKNTHPLLTAFSVISNGRKLLHISTHSKSKEQIETFHGLRVISMMWIVAGHGFVTWQMISVTNRDTVNNWLNQRYAGYIATSPLAVDTFFFMSGFLLAFQYLKMKGKSLTNQLLSVPQMYLHRYLRLTPAMLMVFLVVITIFRHLGTGPLWPFNETLSQSCRDNWWSFFLYIQNYYNYDNLCITQTWYLSADMQMFILSPLILIPLSLILKKRAGFKMSMAEMLCLNVFFTFMPMAIALIFTDYTNEYGTHSRLINYCIGIMLAVFMREKIDKPFLYMFKEHQRYTMNLIIWTVILLGMITLLICYQEVEMHHTGSSLKVFDALKRPAWCIGLSWIVYSCYHGYGGFINWILCRPIFQVLGRLTYCIYLVHGDVTGYYVLSTRIAWFFTDYNAFYLFCGHYIMSVIVAIFWTLAFESPLIIVEKYLMGGGGKSKKHKDAEPRNGNVEGAPTTDHAHDRGSKELPIKDEEAGGMYKRNNEVY